MNSVHALFDPRYGLYFLDLERSDALIIQAQHSSVGSIFRDESNRKMWPVRYDFTPPMSTRLWTCLIACIAFSNLCCISAYAEDLNIAVGLKVGIPYEFIYGGPTPIRSSQTQYIKPSVSGSFEISLPRNLALEMSASYKKTRYHSTVERDSVICSPLCVPVPTFTFDSDSEEHSWEFPLIVRQYLMPNRRTNVFAEGGVALRRSYRTTTTSESITIQSTSTTTTLVPFFPEETKYIRRGFVAGVGVDIPLTALHILPEVRYTRWLSAETIHLTDTANATTANSIEILLGFRFGGKSAPPK